MPHVAWILSDFSTGTEEQLVFPVNPREFDPPNRRATISEELPVAPSGQLIVFQGRDAARRGTMSGMVADSAFYTALEEWANKWYPLTLTDDLGQSWNILITELSWKRLRRAQNPYRFDYTINFLVFQ